MNCSPKIQTVTEGSRGCFGSAQRVNKTLEPAKLLEPALDLQTNKITCQGILAVSTGSDWHRRKRTGLRGDTNASPLAAGREPRPWKSRHATRKGRLKMTGELFEPERGVPSLKRSGLNLQCRLICLNMRPGQFRRQRPLCVACLQVGQISCDQRAWASNCTSDQP